MFVCCECCVLSGRGLCDELITRPEESYRLWCVVCDLETSRMRRPWPALGCSATEKNNPTWHWRGKTHLGMKTRFDICKRLSGLVAATPWVGRRGTSVLTPPLQSVISKMLQGCRCDFLIMRSLPAVMTVLPVSERRWPPSLLRAIWLTVDS
jgi:hypothetical protein